MNTICWGSPFLLAVAVSCPAQTTGPAQTIAPATSTAYAVTERGPHHRVWERTEYEQTRSGPMPKKHRYVELSTGLNFWDAQTGQWVESKEEIEGFPGGAIARQGQHQVIFGNNLNSYGAIDVQTPDGKRLRSNVLGLLYQDTATGKSVVIARLQDSEGRLVSDNEVLYANAFDGVRADVRYTYTKGGFDQSVILLEQPPKPEAYGLDPETTELEVFTEFLDPPDATVKEAKADSTGPEVADEVAWGAISLGQGRAFDLGAEQLQVPVTKRYVLIQGRRILFEKVSVRAVKSSLSSLPEHASTGRNLPTLAGSDPQLPRAPTTQGSSKPIKLALGALPDKGYVLDYQMVNTTLTNFTFQSDSTYYISGMAYLYGTNVFEGGTVIKYTNFGSAGLVLSAAGGSSLWKFETGPYRPAVFTSKNDDSAGEIINGSTGNPAVNNATTYLCCSGDNAYPATPIQNARFAYAGNAIQQQNRTNCSPVLDCQFVHCSTAINDAVAPLQPGYTPVQKLYNVLMSKCGSGVFLYPGFSLVVDGEHMTVDAQSGNLLFEVYGSTATGCFTNCIFTGLSSFIFAPYPFPISGTVNLDHCTQAADGTGIYQPMGGGGYYLVDNSTNRNTGTTNISPALLADLRTKTTYPPIVYSNATISVPTTLGPQAQRDTDVPDLGAHYDPLDLAFGGVTADTNLTFSAGTAVGWFRTTSGYYHAGHGLHLSDRQTVTFDGTATAPCYWARCNMVQEGGNGQWEMRFGPGGITGSAWPDINDSPTLIARFTRFSMQTMDDQHYRDDYGWLIARTTGCEYYGAGVGGYNMQHYHTNCLWVRSGPGFWTDWPDSALVVRNCTMLGGILGFGRFSDGANVPVVLRDNAFDGTSIVETDDDPCANADKQHNAYVTGSGQLACSDNDVTVTSFNWQPGPLGNYYLPTNSSLTNAGSVTADLIGLYHFTTQTNQVKETNSVVDIGYHYVALNASGNPIDTDSDTIPDYLEDKNGNGIVESTETSWLDWDTDGDGLSDAEEATILLDAANPSLGYLDPLNPDTGNTGVWDGDKDSDHDGLSNLNELGRYGSKPTTAHTFNQTATDPEYLFTARQNQHDTLVDMTCIWLPLEGMIRIELTGPPAGSTYDIYLRHELMSPWHYQLWYRGSPGQKVFKFPAPPGTAGYFAAGDAADDDGDGLSNGYEALVNYQDASGNWVKTSLNNNDSDSDMLRDGWEVQWGINPVIGNAAGDHNANAQFGNPDGDLKTGSAYYNELEQTGHTDPLRNDSTPGARPVANITSDGPLAGCEGASFKISLTDGAGTPVTFPSAITVYYILGGSATYGSDYTIQGGLPTVQLPGYPITIPANTRYVNVTVNAVAPTGKKEVIAGLSPCPLSPGDTGAYVVATAANHASIFVARCRTHTFTYNADFDQGLLVGVNHSVSDQLQLDSRLKAPDSESAPYGFRYVGVACSSRDTVVRIDATTATVVGEYRTVPQNIGGSPSRTTVDQFGNIWVGNRNDDRYLNNSWVGSITRIGLIIPAQHGRFVKNSLGSYTQDDAGQYVQISSAIYNTCVDRDGDGYIRTSLGIGEANVLDWPNSGYEDALGGVSTAEDEAITEYVLVPGSGMRSLAVDMFSDLWAGGYDVTSHSKVDGATGQVVPGSTFSSCGGYGAAISRPIAGLPNGLLWSSGGAYWDTMRVELPTDFSTWPPPDLCHTIPAPATRLGYGIATHPANGEAWQTLNNGTQYGLIRWHTDGSAYMDGLNAKIYPHGGSEAKGIVISDDGHIWVAHSGETAFTLGHVMPDFSYEIIDLDSSGPNPGRSPYGVALDFNGKVWAANFNSDNAKRVNPNAGTTSGNPPVRTDAVDATVDLNTGWNTQAKPYNYSDMTGFNNHIVNLEYPKPLKGYWVIIYDSGLDGAAWTATWPTPSIGAIQVAARAADDRLDLSTREFETAVNGTRMFSPAGRFVEVRVAFTRPPNTSGSPILESLTLGYSLPPVHILSQPQSKTVAAGADVTFSVVAAGAPPLTYQWRFNGADIPGATNPTATTPTLALSHVGDPDAGGYSVHVTDAGGETADSETAQLSVPF